MFELGGSSAGEGENHSIIMYIVPLDSILEWGVQSCVAYLHDPTRNIPVKQTKNKHIRQFKGSWFAENLKEELNKCQKYAIIMITFCASSEFLIGLKVFCHFLGQLGV